jgi:hypothetical protein
VIAEKDYSRLQQQYSDYMASLSEVRSTLTNALVTFTMLLYFVDSSLIISRIAKQGQQLLESTREVM